ncbi:hypothetical protein [Fodinicola feengrottensis]|uniref:hypothetical protein n=1 Tax=Fodinicola feengrottensis TaxID=435914 RepID=UPI0024411803|nr:hypothetical protein [Fodinicola feengrottensis]
MKQLMGWLASACIGFVRASVVLAVALVIPALWAAVVVAVIWWGLWASIAPIVWAGIGTVALPRPLSRLVRFLVARWTGTAIAAGYRKAVPVTRMATGYWWNGFTYARSQRDARQQQRWRLVWNDPATWRDLRFVLIAPLTMGGVSRPSRRPPWWRRSSGSPASGSPPRLPARSSRWAPRPVRVAGYEAGRRPFPAPVGRDGAGGAGG